jgi:hypothetical protein
MPLLLFFLIISVTASPPASYSKCRILDCTTNTTFSWTLSTTTLFGKISTKRAHSDGYISLGLSSGGLNPMISSGTIQPTDFWIFTSSVGVLDAKGSTYTSPILDASQDILLEAPFLFDTNTNHLSFEFSRSFLTQDSISLGDDRDISLTSLSTLLWALNPTIGSVNTSSLIPNVPLKLLQHAPNARGVFKYWNWTITDSDCYLFEKKCSIHSHTTESSTLTSRLQCFGNGWPSAELAGDRDGGAATPTLSQQQAMLSSSRACLSSPDGIFKASWSITPTSILSIPQTLTFSLSSAAGGWLAIGFNSNSPGMTGADIIYAWVTPATTSSISCIGLVDCKVIIVDAYSQGHTQPIADTALGGISDITLVNASVSIAGAMSVTFIRTIVSGSSSDVDISKVPVYILWAYGSTPGDSTSLSISQHIGMGASSSMVNMMETAKTCSTTSILTVASNSQKKGGLFALHAVLMTFSFWICFTLAAFTARWKEIFEENSKEEKPLGTSTVQTTRNCPTSSSSITTPSSVLKSTLFSSVPPKEIVSSSDVAFDSGERNSIALQRRRSTLSHHNQQAESESEPSIPSSSSPSQLSDVVPSSTPPTYLTPSTSSSSIKPYALWFRIHVSFIIVGVILAISGLVIVELALRRGQSISVALSPREWSSHQRCGATALCAILLQVLLGLMRPPHGPSLIRNRWLFAHRIVATLSLISAMIAIPLGLQRSGIFSAPAIYVVGVHTILIASYIVFIELGVFSIIAHIVSTILTLFSISSTSVTTSSSFTFSLRSRRICLCIMSISLVLLTSLLSVWVLIQTATPTGIWGGSTFVSPLSQRVYYPSSGQADLCFSMTNFTIPTKETSYVCRAFAFPPQVALHATDFLPLIDRSDVVHHMILYSVDRDYSTRGNFDCSSMPEGTLGPVYVWAVGAVQFSLPSIVGLPVASNIGNTKGVAYGVLQVHYSNTAKLNNIKDSSGIMIKTTSDLRPVSGGLIMLGTNVGSIKIPANRLAFGLSGTCSSSTTKGLPSAKSINPLTNDYVVLASAIHAHTLGRRIWTEQWRGSSRVLSSDGNGNDPLGNQPFYSFSNQQFVNLPVDSRLKPGDELITRCVYENTITAGKKDGNSVAASGKTVNGCESTNCEMCLNFLFIYPMIPANGCVSNANPFCEDIGTDGSIVGSNTQLPSCRLFK